MEIETFLVKCDTSFSDSLRQSLKIQFIEIRYLARICDLCFSTTLKLVANKVLFWGVFCNYSSINHSTTHVDHMILLEVKFRSLEGGLHLSV